MSIFQIVFKSVQEKLDSDMGKTILVNLENLLSNTIYVDFLLISDKS